MAGGEADGSDMEDEWVDHDEDDGDDEYDDLPTIAEEDTAS
jgi:hypothetical protein